MPSGPPTHEYSNKAENLPQVQYVRGGGEG